MATRWAANHRSVGGAGIGRSTLMFETVDDPCAERQKYLTIDPWVYADS